MSMLTRLVLLLTVLALLPFGSFAAKFGTSARAAAVISAQLDDSAGATIAATKIASKTADKTFATAQGRCKGPALPGSPCNPALADWPAAPTAIFNPPARRLPPAAWPVRVDQILPLPPGPPRLA